MENAFFVMWEMIYSPNNVLYLGLQTDLSSKISLLCESGPKALWMCYPNQIRYIPIFGCATTAHELLEVPTGFSIRKFHASISRLVNFRDNCCCLLIFLNFM